MKKIFLTVIGLTLLLSACKKTELDLFPFDQVETTQIFTNANDANIALNGMYFGLRNSGSYYVGTWNIIFEVVGDNVLLSQAGRLSQQAFHNWQYNSLGTTGLFGGGYTIARRANAIIENIDKVPDATQAFKDNAKGQALACRAMIYFDMARTFSKTPLNATATDLSIPYVTSTESTQKPSGEPVSVVYDKIITDLIQANTLIAASNGVGRLNKQAVNALLSKVYLYRGEWAKCVSASNDALGATPVLPNIATFPAIWRDATEQGVIFKIVNTTLDNLNTQGTNYYQTLANGIRSEYVVDFSFRQLFVANDVRLSTYIVASPFNGVQQNHVIKYAGRAGTPVGVLDGKALRTAEVLLNRMEAHYRLNNETGALADLNLLKTNRLTGYANVVLTGQALLDDIFLQRRLEMAFEGDRWFTLKRLNLPVQRSTFGDRADGGGATYLFPLLPAGDFKFNFPYPQGEVNFNTNLKQVSGYN